jgi:hypothetical protein
MTALTFIDPVTQRTSRNAPHGIASRSGARSIGGLVEVGVGRRPRPPAALPSGPAATQRPGRVIRVERVTRIELTPPARKIPLTLWLGSFPYMQRKRLTIASHE